MNCDSLELDFLDLELSDRDLRYLASLDLDLLGPLGPLSPLDLDPLDLEFLDLDRPGLHLLGLRLALLPQKWCEALLPSGMQKGNQRQSQQHRAQSTKHSAQNM